MLFLSLVMAVLPMASAPGQRPAGPAPPPPAAPAADQQDAERRLLEENRARRPRPIPAPPAPAEGRIADFVNLFAVGDPAAPYELIVLADYNCNICRRFEERTYPTLHRRAVEMGLLRIRFVMTTAAGQEREGRHQQLAAYAMLRAGEPLESVVATLRNRRLQSVPQGLNLFPNEDRRAFALSVLGNSSLHPEWDALFAHQTQTNRYIRLRYLDAKGGTPSFLLRLVDAENPWPEPDEVYSFVGFQLPGPFLEFMGLEPDQPAEEAAAESPEAEGGEE